MGLDGQFAQQQLRDGHVGFGSLADMAQWMGTPALPPKATEKADIAAQMLCVNVRYFGRKRRKTGHRVRG